MAKTIVVIGIMLLILALVLIALISPFVIPMGKTKSPLIVLFGGVLAAIWSYHIYLRFLPDNGGYGLGTSIWMFVAVTALYLIVVAVFAAIHWPRKGGVG